MKIIVTKIPTNLVLNSFLFSFCHFVKIKKTIKFSDGLITKCLNFLVIVSHVLLQRLVEFKKFYNGLFLHVKPVCIIFQYFHSMVLLTIQNQVLNFSARNLTILWFYRELKLNPTDQLLWSFFIGEKFPVHTLLFPCLKYDFCYRHELFLNTTLSLLFYLF